MATPVEQAMVALQAEMANTRAQLTHVSQRFDQMAGAHAALQQAHEALRVHTDQAAQRKMEELAGL